LSYDLFADKTINGNIFRMLSINVNRNVVAQVTQYLIYLCSEVTYSISALTAVPKVIIQAVIKWLKCLEVNSQFIELCSPWDNGRLNRFTANSGTNY
jgi:hypothetical protein